MVPAVTKSEKKLFLAQRSRSQGHWPWCHLKGHHYWTMHAKYEVSVSCSSKVIVKVKPIDRRTDKQTGQRYFDPGGIIKIILNMYNFAHKVKIPTYRQ